VELGRLAADRRDRDGVLEQAAGVGVVGLRGGQPTQGAAQLAVRQRPLDRGAQSRVRDLAGEELEESVQLVGVAPERRRQ